MSIILYITFNFIQIIVYDFPILLSIWLHYLIGIFLSTTFKCKIYSAFQYVILEHMARTAHRNASVRNATMWQGAVVKVKVILDISVTFQIEICMSYICRNSWNCWLFHITFYTKIKLLVQQVDKT